jgi:hypothetical protein
MTRTRTAFLSAAAWAILAAACLAGAPEASEQVWLISTRQAPTCFPADDADTWIQYWRYAADDQWTAADAQAFQAADDPRVPTIIVVHGNRAGCQTAIREGWTAYRCLQQQASGRPFRFVIWSWPADRIAGGNLQDVRVKAARSDVQAWYLAQVVRRINPKVPVSMIGFSFGARAITGALHVLSGGPLFGRTLGEEKAAAARVAYRAVLLGAAVDRDWLLPCGCNGLALNRADRILVSQNTCDSVLRWYPLMYGLHGPEALGFAGPACRTMLDQGKLEVVHVNCEVGKSHDWYAYLCAPDIQARLAWYAFLAPEGAEPSGFKAAAANETPAAETQMPALIEPVQGE